MEEVFPDQQQVDDDDSFGENCSIESEDEEEDESRKSQFKELGEALKKDSTICLARDCELAQAESLFRQKKYGKAYEAYFFLDGKQSFLRSNASLKLPYQVFIQSRLVLCLLAQKKYVAEFLEDLVPAAARDPRILECLVLYLYAEREYRLCVFVCLRGLKLFPRFELFRRAIDQCLKSEPDLIRQVPGTPWCFFLDLKIVPELFSRHNPGKGGVPSLRETERCKSVEALIRRTEFCLLTRRESLAQECLRSLSQVDSVRDDDKVMYQYCRAVVLMNLGGNDNLKSSQSILKILSNATGPNYFEVFYGLAQVQIKLKLYSEAETTIRTGLEESSKSLCISFNWPARLCQFFPESNCEILESLLRKQLSLINCMRIPAATCRFEECLHVTKSGFEPRRREIFSGEPIGFYSVKCTERCSIEFHQACWKKAKESRKDCRTCWTPDCKGSLVEILFKKDSKEVKVKDPILNLKSSHAVALKHSGGAKNAKDSHSAKEVKKEVSRNDQKESEKDKSGGKAAMGGKQKENLKSENIQVLEIRGENQTPPNVKTISGESVQCFQAEEKSRQDTFGGAIPKYKPPSAGQKRQIFSQKVIKLGQMRENFQKDLRLCSGDSNPEFNTQNVFFSMVKKSDAIFTIDDGNFLSCMANQEARKTSDLIREKMVEFKRETKKKELRKDESEIILLKQQLLLEKELSFYLYQCVKKDLLSKKNRRKRNSMFSMPPPGFDAQRVPNVLPVSSGLESVAFPSYSREQNGTSFSVEMSLKEMVQEMNRKSPQFDDLAEKHVQAFSTCAITDDDPAISVAVPEKPDPEMVQILMAAFPHLTEKETENLVLRCEKEVTEEEYDKLDEAEQYSEDIPEDVLEELLDMKKKGLLFQSASEQHSFDYVDVDDACDTNLVKECVVCLENISYEDEFILRPCKHCFHKVCIKKWFKEKSECPSCRNHIVLEEEYPALAISAASGKMRR